MGNVMNQVTEVSFWYYNMFIIMVFVCGLYYVMATRNLIRVLIGMELLTKAVTLLLILAGYVTKHMALAQALVINLIVVEVVVIAVSAGIVLCVHKNTGSLDAGAVKNLKG
jgi:NADH-quinone oxidoreductase subunit K